MRENRLYGSAGGGARERSPYPHRDFVTRPVDQLRWLNAALDEDRPTQLSYRL